MANWCLKDEHTYTETKNPLAWSRDERFILYGILRHNKGSKRMQKLQEGLPNKTLEEIKAALEYYRTKAVHHPACDMHRSKMRRSKTKPLIPLASWAKVLTDNLKYKNLQTEIHCALRLIADLEDTPAASDCDQIDFQNIYHQIADAMEGKPPAYNKLHAEVINSCILDTALTSRSFVKLSTYKHITSAVSFKDVEMPIFPRPTKDNRLSIIRHLSSQRNYNPLGISEDNFRPVSASSPE